MAMDGDKRRGVVQDLEDPVTVEIMSEAERLVIKAVQNEAFLRRIEQTEEPAKALKRRGTQSEE